MGIKIASRLPRSARWAATASRLSRAVRRRPGLPMALLVVLCLASTGARAAGIGLPCRAPCRTPADHLLIFDERYYVNAARVMAGIRPPAIPGTAYRHAPLGSDPNAEHPPLAKLIMAGSIELVGNRPWGWRLGSVLFGTLGILGLFALVRWGGGSRWLALGGATLMAADNLMIVQGRIGILEVYVVAAMVWSVALYLRGRPLLAGLVAGIGACMKLFALDVVVVLAIYELLRWPIPPIKARVRSLAGATLAMAASFLGLLAALDHLTHPYDNAARRFVGSGPFAHLAHMISYASAQTGLAGGNGIASYPWQWLVDYRPIVYLGVDPGQPGPGLAGVHPAVHFLGLISPPILLAGLAGLALAVWRLVRRGAVFAWRTFGEDTLVKASLAWFLGTFGPFLIASLAFNRTTYLYYMTIVMPGLYVAGAWLVARLRRRWWLVSAWVACVVAAAVLLYPLLPLS